MGVFNGGAEVGTFNGGAEVGTAAGVEDAVWDMAAEEDSALPPQAATTRTMTATQERRT